jgi:hypothetical protein
MKFLWLGLFVVGVALLAVGYFALPDAVFNGPKVVLFGELIGLTLAVNAVLYLIVSLELKPAYLSRLLVPNRSYWLSSEERARMLAERLKTVSVVTGAYVDFLVTTTAYMMLHYYYPYRLPCPRHVLMLLVWIVASVGVLVFSFGQFRKPR